MNARHRTFGGNSELRRERKTYDRKDTERGFLLAFLFPIIILVFSTLFLTALRDFKG